MLDICVALTERADEDEQIVAVVKADFADPTSADPVPCSTQPNVTRRRSRIPGRAIVNWINLEAGEDKADVVARWPGPRGGADRADGGRVGMAKTAERKVEIATASATWSARSTASTPRR